MIRMWVRARVLNKDDRARVVNKDDRIIGEQTWIRVSVRAFIPATSEATEMAVSKWRNWGMH